MSIVFDSRETLIALLKNRSPHLSQAQGRVAQYLLHHYAEVPFMTTSELAQAVGTSQASVTRFAAALGFDNYAEFSKALSQVVLGEIGRAPPERFVLETGDAQLVLQSEIEHLQSLSAMLGSEAFARCVQRLGSAPRVLLAGFGAALPVLQHAALYLTRLRPGVVALSHLEASNFVQLAHFKPGDYVLLFAVPRYPRETFTLAALLREQGLGLGLISDRADIALAAEVSELLLAPVTLSPTSAIPAAALVLVSLLLDAVGRKNRRRTLHNLQAFEDLAASSRFFAGENPPEVPYWETHLAASAQAAPKRRRKS